MRALFHRHSPIVAVLAAFITLAFLYSIVIPLFEGPDEDDHFRYVKFIADHHALPVQLFQAGGGAAGHQGWQPPLYYAIAAVVIAPINTLDFEQHLWRNPNSSYQGDPACCGRNLYFHRRSEDFPFTGTTLAVHVARGVSILFGVLTVAATYALMLEISAGKRWLSLGAASIVGFNPGFIFASSLVSNDTALAAFSTLALLIMVQILRGTRPPNLSSCLLLGIVIALAILTKSTGLILLPLALAVVTFVAWKAWSPRVALTSALGIIVPCVLLSGWWFIRNQLLYGDPLASRLIFASAIFPREQPLTTAEFLQINLPWMWQTFWGGPTPGDFSPILLFFLGCLCFVGLIGLFISPRLRNAQLDRMCLMLLAVWLGLIFLAQVQFIRISGGTDQGRYLFPAVASFAILLAMGCYSALIAVASLISRGYISGNSAARVLALVLTAAGLALASSVLLFNTLPAYARPTDDSASALKLADHQLDVSFEDSLALRGYSLSGRSLHPGETELVTLIWQALKPMEVSYRVFVHLVGKNNQVAGGKDVVPYRGAYATVLWSPGEWIKDSIAVPIKLDAVAADYQVEIGIYPFDHPDDRLHLSGSDQDHLLVDQVTIVP